MSDDWHKDIPSPERTVRLYLETIIKMCDMGINPATIVSANRMNAKAAIELLDNAERETVACGLTMVREWDEATDRVLITDPLGPASPLPPRMGPGQICTCGHTLGCNCGKCPHCVRPDAPTMAELFPAELGPDE